MYLGSNVYQFVFEQTLMKRRYITALLKRLRALVLKYHDPVVHYNLNGNRIAINMSHMLPFYMNSHPLYSTNLQRLARYIRSSFGRLCMIDVGANVGDSYYLTEPTAGDLYMLIEGDQNYFALLVQNTLTEKSAVLVHTLVSDKIDNNKSVLSSKLGGTARIAYSDRIESSNHFTTVDELIDSYPSFEHTNLLKTDVEGYDCKVLMGSLNLIESTQPVIFFEHHPRLLAEAGEDTQYIFKTLASFGYSELIIYDCQGFLIGLFDARDSQVLENLVYYAKYKPNYYYDICCFSDKDTQVKRGFLDQEFEFYSAWRKSQIYVD